MQELIIIILFAGALVYLGLVIRRSVRTDKGCSKNCGCDTSASRQPTNTV